MTKQGIKDRTKDLVDKLLSGDVAEKYHGKQVVIIGDTSVILPNDDNKAARLVERLEKKYPGQIPHLVSVPRPETYTYESRISLS